MTKVISTDVSFIVSW